MDIEELQDKVGKFNDLNFPGQTLEGVLAHLHDETAELKDSHIDLMEWADVLILFLAAVHRSGMRPGMIVSLAEIKMIINANRKWPSKPDERGVFHHVELGA